MKCEKVRLREDILIECPLCYEEAEQCNDCGVYSAEEKEKDWYCYNDGEKHFCNKCWEQTLKKR